MASITTNTDFVRPSPIKRALSSILNGLISISANTSRVREMEALMALSDAQLAERGLKREEIARYVFRDTYFV
ncbi:MAG: DUF1127 domain-containing protein [Rhodobacteraceae bacterium]|nr:DUF1127 domain-containing protein [Paracoccaceae bacterium]